jgi:DnaJ-domain-containing protein 1
MTDCFSLLGEPRRPWLDPEILKQKFLSLSTTLHPDRVHGLDEQPRREAEQRYSELNAAYHCLRDPRDRIRHLLELELGPRSKSVQRVPSDLMDLSIATGDACRQADAFLAQQSTITSPLLKAQSFERAQAFSDKLQELLQSIRTRVTDLDAAVREADRRWSAGDRGALSVLEEISHLYGYYSRWSNQLQERIVRLTF